MDDKELVAAEEMEDEASASECEDDDGSSWSEADSDEFKEEPCREEDNCTLREGQEDSKLLALPKDFLVRICWSLRPLDLVRLGWVCRALRSASRDPNAWRHAHLHLGDGRDRRRNGIMRVAPALHTLTVEESWPAVNLLKCTRRVRVFDLVWDDYENEPYSVPRMKKVLEHYRGHLQVLKLGCLESEFRDEPREAMELLRFIDKLGVRELHIKGRLAKVYPGCTRTVTELTAGREVSGAVLAALLRAARRTLLAFHVSPYNLKKNEWFHDVASAVGPALMRCAALRAATVRIWSSPRMLDSFPALRSLCLLDLGDVPHDDVRAMFASSAGVRGLRSLKVHLGFFGHRGMIKAVAEGCCTDLEELTIEYRSVNSRSLADTVDVPRDLHLILGRLARLRRLALDVARVPSTVVQGIADGALPSLRELVLDYCGVTGKARAALAALAARRPEVRVKKDLLQRARRRAEWVADSRCPAPLCAPPSDCEDEDPVSDTDNEPNDTDSSFEGLSEDSVEEEEWEDYEEGDSVEEEEEEEREGEGEGAGDDKEDVVEAGGQQVGKGGELETSKDPSVG